MSPDYRQPPQERVATAQNPTGYTDHNQAETGWHRQQAQGATVQRSAEAANRSASQLGLRPGSLVNTVAALGNADRYLEKRLDGNSPQGTNYHISADYMNTIDRMAENKGDHHAHGNTRAPTPIPPHANTHMAFPCNALHTEGSPPHKVSATDKQLANNPLQHGVEGAQRYNSPTGDHPHIVIESTSTPWIMSYVAKMDMKSEVRPTEGAKLVAVRNPTAFDKNAIALNTADGKTVGYMTAGLAAALAPYIDKKALTITDSVVIFCGATTQNDTTITLASRFTGEIPVTAEPHLFKVKWAAVSDIIEQETGLRFTWSPDAKGHARVTVACDIYTITVDGEQKPIRECDSYMGAISDNTIMRMYLTEEMIERLQLDDTEFVLKTGTMKDSYRTMINNYSDTFYIADKCITITTEHNGKTSEVALTIVGIVKGCSLDPHTATQQTGSAGSQNNTRIRNNEKGTNDDTDAMQMKPTGGASPTGKTAKAATTTPQNTHAPKSTKAKKRKGNHQPHKGRGMTQFLRPVSPAPKKSNQKERETSRKKTPTTKSNADDETSTPQKTRKKSNKRKSLRDRIDVKERDISTTQEPTQETTQRDVDEETTAQKEEEGDVVEGETTAQKEKKGEEAFISELEGHTAEPTENTKRQKA